MYHGHADPFFYNPTVSLPMLLATVGMVSSVSQNSLNVCLDLLYHNFAIRCTGSHNANWFSSFKQALSIYLAGGSLCRGYNAELNHVLDWCVYQRNNKQHLEREKQYLLGVIRI
jgi:hypothetical protein